MRIRDALRSIRQRFLVTSDDAAAARRPAEAMLADRLAPPSGIDLTQARRAADDLPGSQGALRQELDDAERQQAAGVRPALSDDIQLKTEEKSSAQIKAEALQAEFFRQMTIENTPLGFYDDRYDMGDFPEEVDPAPSELAEQALLQHLREHPELRQNPVWAAWYVGVDETASDNELRVGSAAHVPHGDDAAATSEAR